MPNDTWSPDDIAGPGEARRWARKPKRERPVPAPPPPASPAATPNQPRAKGEQINIGPQPGPQTQFLTSEADIGIFGGSSGCGKSHALLLEPLYHITKVPSFGSVAFRRTTPQLRGEGGLWDSSTQLYPLIGAIPREADLEWLFAICNKDGKQIGRNRLKMSHIEHERNRFDWDSTQIPLILFDQVECFHPETEVLAATGWTPIAEIQEGELVASLSPDRHIEFRPATPVCHEFDGQLVCCNKPRGLRFRVTPNHRFVINRQDDAKSWGFKRADSIRQDRILRAGRWVGTEVEWYDVQTPIPVGRGHAPHRTNAGTRVQMDDWLEFLGWWFSEGCIYVGNKRYNTSRGVNITQCDLAKVAAIRAIFIKLPWRFTEKRVARPGVQPITAFWIWSSQLYTELSQFGTCSKDKRLPRWLLSLSIRQLRLFWDAFVSGDGSYDNRGAGGLTIASASAGLIDDLQEMAFRLGLVATVRHSIVRGFNVAWLIVSKPGRQATAVHSHDLYRESYHGPVYCLSVPPNANFLARVRGRCFWSGNSFSDKIFWHLVGRNRSTCGVRPYIRASCNPVSSGWLHDLVCSHWVGEDGNPIKERSGDLRWMVRMGEETMWSSDRAELVARVSDEFGLPEHEVTPLSVTFIPGLPTDNKILMEKDPTYLAKLRALPRVERERLLHGNWKVVAGAGDYFQRAWCELVSKIPNTVVRWVRSWDLAGTRPSAANQDPDWSVGVRAGLLPDRRVVITSVIRRRDSPGQIQQLVLRTAEYDGRETRILLNQDPGQAGKDQVEDYVRLLRGYQITTKRETGSKEVRAGPFSSGAEHGQVLILRGQWNEPYLSELENFPRGAHDDDMDSTANAFSQLAGKGGRFALLDPSHVHTRPSDGGFRQLILGAQGGRGV